MNFIQRIVLGVKVIFGRYDATIKYRNPKVGLSEVTLHHKGVAWLDA